MLVYQIVLLFIVPYVFCESSNMLRFSTKTPYIFRQPIEIANYKDFSPRRVWGIYRHGTRLPGKKVISKYYGLSDLVEKLQLAKNLTAEEKAKFKNWTPMNINLEHQKFLTKEGEEELFLLGSRFRHQFSQLISDEQSTFVFKHTPTQRTNLSARKFIEGLFQNNTTDYEINEVARDDVILRPYKGCQLWRKNVKKNPNTLNEKKSLIESESMKNLIDDMREMTQIDYLDFKDIELIYTMCGFETSWRHQLHEGKSIWCSLFKNENYLKTFEYLEDLEYYWIDGPGFEITRKVACKTVEDMLSVLNPSQNDKRLTFYFTHSGTILKLLTFLGLYQDDFELTADKLNHDRKWRTSLIDTFSTNILAILYDSIKYGVHIQLIHQESIVKIPNCVSNEFGMCKYEDFERLYREKIQNCNLTRICNTEKDEL